MPTLLAADALTVTFAERVVLSGVSLTVGSGERMALLGRNGAGKTTALECMEGLRKFEEGSIAVNGRMGIQLQSSSLPEQIRAMEAVRLFVLPSNCQ